MLSMKIPGRPEFVGVVRLVIAGLATRLNCHQEEIEDLKVAVAEACNNAVLNIDNESEILVSCIMEMGKLSIVVTNQGSCPTRKKDGEGKSCSSPLDKLEMIDSEETWLLLIRALMDEVECKVGRGMRRSITMVKYLGKQYS